MVAVYRECSRICRGLVAFVVEGKTHNFRWSATPALLMADLHRAGFNLRKFPAYHRSGVSGSGGPDWLRNNFEPIVCITRPGRLPWSDNTACGLPCVYRPGGAMSHRTKNGARVNGEVEHTKRKRGREVSYRHAGGTMERQTYKPPKIANPGNVIHCKVGGGRMGHPLAHESEAAFSLTLAEFFVRSFCPPDGVCIDPFTGSGTTGHACLLHGRRFVGCDVRESQVEIARRRLREIEGERHTSKVDGAR